MTMKRKGKAPMSEQPTEQQPEQPKKERMLLSSIPKSLPGMKGTIDPAVRELGALASSTLGYDKLHSKTTKTASLVELLTEMEVEVLETSAVDTFMAERIEAIKAGTEPMPSRREMANVDEDDDEPEIKRRLRWSRWFFSNYPLDIPEEVLALAIQIKQREPGVDFNIHAMGKLDVDPFLSVNFQNETFYIAAWDEPKFTGKLTKASAERANLRNKPVE